MTLTDISQQQLDDLYLSTLEQETHTGAWHYHYQSQCLFATPQAMQVFAIPQHTPANIRLSLVQFTAKSLLRFKRCLARCEQGEPFDAQFELNEQGKSRWLRLKGDCHNVNGHSAKVVGTVNDETDKMHEQMQMSLGVDAGGIGLWLLNIAEDQLYWNSQMYDIYGKDPQQQNLGFEDWRCRVHPEDVDNAVRIFQSAVTNKQLFLHDFRIITEDGTVKYIKAKARPLYNDRGDAIKAVGVNIDITDLKREEERVQQERERRYAYERLATIGELASGVGHEINNPLAVIMGQLELMDSMIPTIAADKLVAVITAKHQTMLEASVRIKEIVSGLKQLSRDESHDALTDIEIDDLLNAVATFTRQLYGDQHIRFDILLLEQSCHVTGHFGQLQQVLLNLVNNAKDALYHAEDKHILLGSQIVGNEVNLFVEDNGVGIAEDRLDNIFDSFYTSKDKDHGTGLGLSIAKRIVTAHGGNIKVQSQPSQGSRFDIHLPIATLAVNHQQRPTQQ